MVVKVNEKLGPHPDLKKLYYTYLAIGTFPILLAILLIVTVSGGMLAFTLRGGYVVYVDAWVVAVVLLLPLFLVACFVGYWIPKYYESISYLFTKDEIIVERGVWWRKKGFVPYNRITNININQGPISRQFGLGTLRIQTAGYSGGGGRGRVAEAVVLGVKNFEELKDFIMDFVRRIRPIAVEAGPEVLAPEEIDRQILEELKKIRETLEKVKA